MSDDQRPPALTLPASDVPARTDAEAHFVAPREPVPPTFGKAQRALFAVCAGMCFIVAAILGFGSSAFAAVSMIAFGAVMAFFALTGKRPADPALAPGSARFHELADPARPLAPEDLSLQEADRGRLGNGSRAGRLAGGPGT